MISYSEKTKVVNSKLPLKVKWGYGVTGYASSIFFLNFVFYTMYFYTDIIGIAPALAGSIISVCSIYDAFTDPIIGYLSDKRDPKKGRRRPFLLWAAVPLAVFTFLSFYNPHLSPSVLPIYLVIVICGASTCDTMVDIPYTALGAEMTSNYDERSSLNTYRNIFWNIGMFLSCAFLMIVEWFAKLNGGDMSAGFAYTSLVCAAPILVCILITYFSTKGYELTDIKQQVEKFSFKEKVIEPFKNRPFRYIAGVFTLSIIAQAINNAVGVYYFVNNLGLNPGSASLLFVFSAIIGFGDSWFAGSLIKKFSKKVAWAVCIGGWCFSTLVMALFIMQPGAPIWMLVVFVIFNGLGLNVQYQLVYAMIPDCIEVDEFKTGQRREGMFLGLTNLLQKVSAAITMGVVGFILGAIGYDGMAATQTPGALFGIKMLFGFGCGIFLLASIILNRFNPMSRERHKALVDALELKKSGKEYSTKGFEQLL